MAGVIGWVSSTFAKSSLTISKYTISGVVDNDSKEIVREIADEQVKELSDEIADVLNHS